MFLFISKLDKYICLRRSQNPNDGLNIFENTHFEILDFTHILMIKLDISWSFAKGNEPYS